jgi:hypothetical protein
MARLSLSDLQQLAAQTGFADPALAAAVAMAESGGNPNAYNTEGSYGLWQVDINFHPEFQSNPSVLFDPTTNAQAAYAISSGGTNWQWWSTYKYPCSGPHGSGPPCYLQFYHPAPAQTATASPSSNVALGVAALVGIAVLSYFGYQAAERRGYV